MGIPVIDHDDPAGYAEDACCACECSMHHHSNKEDQQSKTTASTQTAFEATNASTNTVPNYHESKTETLNTPPSSSASFSKSSKDLVGNSKEFRIEHNKCDLRIIGNSNRIRIGCNVGNLQIIGNSTRLKISNNSGRIRYMGNDGRICLGSDSRQQTIDYIGNNGILKVVNSEQLSGAECQGGGKKNAKKCFADKKAAAASSAPTASASSTQCHAKKVKVKAASYGGDCSVQWQKFHEMFQRHGWQRCANVSLPNLGEHCPRSHSQCGHHTNEGRRSKSNSSKHCKIDNSINVVNNYGNIIIKNAVNVSI